MNRPQVLRWRERERESPWAAVSDPNVRCLLPLAELQDQDRGSQMWNLRLPCKPLSIFCLKFGSPLPMLPLPSVPVLQILPVTCDKDVCADGEVLKEEDSHAQFWTAASCGLLLVDGSEQRDYCSRVRQGLPEFCEGRGQSRLGMAAASRPAGVASRAQHSSHNVADACGGSS